MYSITTTTSKQVLVWAIMFTLVLSVFPTTVADEADDEWFWDIEENVTDEDGDGSDDTIEIGYDPDTTCDCDINITVYVDIYDENGYVEYIYDYHTIYGGQGDWFTQDWTPDYSGTFDFYVEMYDEWNNYEDNWNVTDIELTPMSGSSDETINVGNFVYDDDEDGIYNDLEFRALVKDDGIEDVEVNVEYFNGVIWTSYTNGTTDDEGFLLVKNATTGEYRWTAEYDNTDLEEATVSYTEVDTVTNLSHDIGIFDLDGAGDHDDIGAILFEDDDTKDDGYVEVYDEDGVLYDSGNTDTDWYGVYTIYALYDVEKGNYTFDFYYEEDGELLQSGWLHSYGSTSTNYDEWFEDWDYETEDTNGDGVANNIITSYDPDTECNCTIDIEVYLSVYNNDTGDYAYSDFYDHEINGTDDDWFETDEWSPSKNSNYTFEFYLYDENENYEDQFNFTVYLECDGDSNDSDCDNDEWFEDWDYDTESTDDDNLVDTINVDYDPDTDCDCEVNVYVYMDVYENASGNLVDYTDGQYHEINGTEEEYFTQSWTSRNSTSYDFYVYMNDDNWNYEDEFWVYNVFLYAKSGAGGPGDDDEWFDWIDAYTYDDDDDGYDDTAELDYDPDTTCECDINITLYIDIYDNETGYWVNGTEEDYTIYSDDDDYWYQEWSPEYNGTFDFYVELYDEDGNLEDEEEYLNISLHARSSGGGGDGDDDEWFYSWDHDVDPSDTITIDYDPDTECDCNITIYVYVDVYDNETGDYLDYTYAEHEIYNGYYDEFSQDWTAYENGNYDFDVYMYDEDYNFEDEFWIYDVYLESDGGGGGNGTGDDNGIGHVGESIDWDEDDGYVNDYVGAVTEDGDWRYEAYFEIYDENWNWVDGGTAEADDGIFVTENLDEGNYYHYIYYDEGAEDEIHYGIFYSYGESSGEDSGVINVDMAVIEDSDGDGEPELFCEEGPCDDAFFKAHEGNWENGTSDVVIEIYEYDSGTGDTEYYDTVYTNDSGEAVSYDNPCGEYVWNATYYDDEIDKGYYQVWAGCDGTGGGGDNDEWFYDWDHNIDSSDTITIGYDPDTECDCYVNITVYVDVYDNVTGDWVDWTYDDHIIYNGEGDWFEQDWTASNDGTYDFWVNMYDGDGNEEDEFWIYDVYLESDDGGGGNGSDDDNGVGHAGFVDDWEDDGYVNDYIGFVLIEDYFKEDAYFEIYQDGELVDSGHAVNEWFVSSDLPEGWYEHVVYYEEDGPVLQDGPFYSYGNSSNPETSDIVNVDNAVVDDDEYAVYDDVGFIAHRGNSSTGEEGVEIAVYVWNEEEEAWYDHAYLVTNETGEAWLYNEACGTYEWESYNVDEKGHYEVLAGCDDTGGGDDDYNEWFYDLDYYGTEDDEWNKLIIGYNPDTECNCDVEIEVYVDVHDSDTGDYVGSLYDSHTIYNGEGDWFEQEWTADSAGKYDFYVELYDQEYGHPEDSFEFSLIMSDEWFIDEFYQEGATVYIDLDPQTNYEGEIGTYYYLGVFRLDENDEWELIDEQEVEDVVITGSNDNEDIHFEWTAEDDGKYRFQVEMEDEYWNLEDISDFETEIVLNQAPVIEDLNVDLLFEGQQFDFEVDAFDADNDELEYTWDMGDGSSKKEGDSVRYGYQDNGVYTVTVWVSDGEFTTVKEFEIVVENMAPALEVSFDDEADEGSELSFAAQVNDVASDDVTVTWTFADGSRVEGIFAQYTFRDNGEYLVVVVAEDEDGGTTMQQLLVTINNVAPAFTQFVMPSGAEEDEALDFMVSATDPGDDTITYTFDFGDGTAIMMTPDGNISHKFADGDTFTIVICAQDEDGGESCRTETLPVSILEQLEEEGLLPGFGVLGALSALGMIGILRRRTH